MSSLIWRISRSPASFFAELSENNQKLLVERAVTLYDLSLIHIYDLNLVLQKRHALLNWQQGSGKTAAVYHREMCIRDRISASSSGVNQKRSPRLNNSFASAYN